MQRILKNDDKLFFSNFLVNYSWNARFGNFNSFTRFPTLLSNSLGV